jgi:hypothetical protein
MKNNIHPVERGIRVGAGLFLMSLAFWGPNNYWYLLGVIPLMTGLSGFCPLYSMLGVSTCKFNDSHSPHLNP